jgi:hypothetical protein
MFGGETFWPSPSPIGEEVRDLKNERSPKSNVVAELKLPETGYVDAE